MSVIAGTKGEEAEQGAGSQAVAQWQQIQEHIDACQHSVAPVTMCPRACSPESLHDAFLCNISNPAGHVNSQLVYPAIITQR